MIKVYDSSNNKYVTVAANRGDKLYTKNINFTTIDNKNYQYVNDDESSYDDNTDIITIDNALSSISKEIKTVKEGIAWVYKNGTLGGGGGSGSSSRLYFDVNVNNNATDTNITIVSGTTLRLGFIAKGLPVGKEIVLSIIINDDYLNEYKNKIFKVVSSRTFIELENITKNTIVIINAYDATTFEQFEDYTLNINIANLFINGTTSTAINPNNESTDIKYVISSTTNIETSINAEIRIPIYDNDTLNYTTKSYYYTLLTKRDETELHINLFELNMFKDIDNNYLNFRDILNNDINKNINDITIIIGASTEQFKTPIIHETTVSLIYDDEISIDITKFSSLYNKPNEAFILGDDVQFDIILSHKKYNKFSVYYHLYQNIDNNKNIIYQSTDNPNNPDINRPTGNYFVSPIKVTLPYNILSGIDINEPIYIYVKVWSNDQVIISEKTEWTKISSADESVWKPYNIAFSGIDNYEDPSIYAIKAYWNQTNISTVTNSSTWQSINVYNQKSNTFIEYYNCNDIVNGLLQEEIKNNKRISPKKLRFSSKAYATIKNNNNSYFSPFNKVEFGQESSNWFIGDNGWTISLLYKADEQDDDAVIFDYSIKNINGEITQGILITASNITVRFKDNKNDNNSIPFSLSTILSKNVVNAIDIVFEKDKNNTEDTESSIGKLKIYVNGIMMCAAVAENALFDINNKPSEISSPIYIGAKNIDSSLSNYADFDLYRLIFYNRSLTHYHIIKNYIQGSYETYYNENGEKDKEYNLQLRTKNFFENDGTCSLCINDINNYKSFYTFYSGVNLYNIINERVNNILPIVKITVEDGSEFYDISKYRWPEDIANDKNSRVTQPYKCNIYINDKGNKLDTATDGYAYTTNPSIKLQGTSTLGYVSKNYQISFGTDSANNPYLAQIFDDMLPENEWILKADIVDSAHANNAAVGKFINDFLSADSSLSGVDARDGVDNNGNNKYASELKHTSVGKPCILFIEYTGHNEIKYPVYLGIYSFNLGRISHYNLGYKVFNSYYQINNTDIKYNNHKISTPDIKLPAIVSKYSEFIKPYGNAVDPVCYECTTNNGNVASFQQADPNIINAYYRQVFPENQIDNNAFNSLSKIFIITTQLYEYDPDNELTNVNAPIENESALRTRGLYIRNVDGEFKLKNENNKYEQYNPEHINNYEQYSKYESSNAELFNYLIKKQGGDIENRNAGLEWGYASAYFVLACLFGMVDSLGKNLNLRSFNHEFWYTSFYDMDTGLGIDNRGQDTIKNDVYLDAFSLSNDLTQIAVNQNGYINGFNTYNSRLWNIIRNVKSEAGNNIFYNTNYRKIWENLRANFLSDPNIFINNYYLSQNKNVGNVIYNLDYDVKYINDALKKIQGVDVNDENINVDFTSSLSFLHGNRENFVKDWFPKHVYFLDGVFDLGCQANDNSSATQLLYGENKNYGYSDATTPITANINKLTSISSPYLKANATDRLNGNGSSQTFNVKLNMPSFLILSAGDKNVNRYYIKANEYTKIKYTLPSNTDTTYATNHTKNIINFDDLKDLRIKSFTMDFPNLEIFNISNMPTLNISDINTFNTSKLINLKKFIMPNVKNTYNNEKLHVNLNNSKKLNTIDISNSDVNVLSIYSGGVLENINISKTDISQIDLSNQTLLKTFNAEDAKNLVSVNFENCISLTDIGKLPNTIGKYIDGQDNKLVFNNCNSITNISLNGMKYINNDNFILGHLENLKEFTYTKDSRAESYLTELDFSGCPNIEKISLAGFNGTYIILNTQSTQTLKDINISNSNISYILWADTEDSENIIYYKSLVDDRSNVLDFNKCVNITNVNIQGNKTIEYVLLPESSTSQININILGCDNLRRITGNLGAVNVNKFKNLSNFYFNELCKYDDDDTTSNIIIDVNGNVDFDVSIGNLSLDDNDVNDPSIILRKYQSKHLLTHYSFIEDGASLNDSFSNTSINISDLYSILLKLKNWKSDVYKDSEENPYGYITKFNGTFKNCKNIKTYQRDYDTTGSGIIKDNGIIFYSDYEIERKNIKIDIFTGYNNLKYLSSTFAGCSNIRGHIAGLSDNDKSSIFAPAENLMEIDSVFVGCGELYVTSNIFNNNKKLVKISQPFSESTCFSINDTTYYPNEGATISKLNEINLGLLFNGLEQLIEISKVFFNTQIVYNFESIDEMFKTTKDLKIINYILPNNYKGGSENEMNTLSLSNIFGGCYRAYKDGVLADETYNKVPNDLDNLYPRKLTNLDYAFATNGNDEEQPMLNWDNLDYIFYNLDSSINYEVSLESCKYMFDKLAYVKIGDDDGYYNYTRTYNGSPEGTLATFPTNIFTIKRKDGDIYNDVYFSKLSNIEGLFMRSAFKDELKFPGNIFKYCTAENLNLSHLLEDTIMTPIKLVNEDDGYACFTNCKLDNVSSMFKNCFKGINKKDFTENAYKPYDISTNLEGKDLYKLDRGGLHGTIPYKFFKNKGKISNMENVFEGCCHLGTNVNLVCDASGNYSSGNGDFIARNETCFYNIKKPDLQTVIDVSNNVKDVSALLDLVEFDNGVWKWNAWSYDGTTFDSSYLEALNNIDLNGETYIEAKHNNIPNYILIKDENNICSDENGNYVKPNSLNDVSILFNTSSNMWRSLNVDNCFIKFGDDYELNNDGIKCIKIYYDADYDIKNVNFDTKYLGNNMQLWNCDYYTYISRDQSSESYKHDDKLTATKFISNYAYPMDLFKYCAANCNINSIFKNISRFNNDDKRQKYNDFVYGIIGRIPPKLFDTLTGTVNMQNIFEGNKGIVPYSQSFDGQFYNEMFINNTALVNIDGLFTGCMFLGHISDRLFKNNNIKSILELCKNGYMPPEYADNNENHIDYISFVSKDTFNSNSGIQNISGAFSRDNNQDSYISKDAYLYFDLSTDMFAINKHVNISNASKLFENQSKGINRTFTGTGNDIIDFRRWPYIGKNYSNCYSNTNFNLNEIPKDLGGSLENE